MGKINYIMEKGKITIKEIAKELHMSIATVSRAINPSTQSMVSKSTLKKILAYVEKTHYSPSMTARRLVTGKSYNIVIFFKPEFKSAFYNDYYSKMIAGAMDALKGTQYKLLISIIPTQIDGYDIPKAIRELDVAGAVLCNFMGVVNFSAKNIFNADVPVIIINQYSKEKNPNCFLIDNFRGAYEATTYLINMGHQRIGFVRGTSIVKDAVDREKGYRKALEDRDIPFRSELCFQGDFVERSGKLATHYFCKGHITPPTAVFCSNDLMAIGMINELKELGIKCPEDVSVIGFDGIDSGKYTKPALTTVRQPIYEMSYEAVREVVNEVETEKKFDGTKFFSTKIIERESVIPFYKMNKKNTKGGKYVFRERERDTSGAGRG